MNVKHVRFDRNVIVHYVEYFDRKGLWEIDRLRFHNRIQNLSFMLDLILTSQHRKRIFTDRYSNQE